MEKVLTKKSKILILLGVMLVMFLAAMDMTVVSTAMPKIVEKLNGMQYYSWIFTIYTLVSTISIPIFGKLSDIYGRKYFMIVGIIVFLLGSAISGLSQNVIELIIFRGIQGLGAGIVMGIAFAVLTDVYSPKELGKYMGIMMSFSALASIIGPSLGGFITDSWSWRWCFYINIPFGILSIIILLIALPVIKNTEGHKKVDYLGGALTATTFVPLLLALTWGGNEYAWGSATILWLLIGSFISLVALLIVEFRVKEPIIPIPFFKNRIFTVSVAVNFLVSIAMFGVIMYIPLYMQNVLGITATNSGAITTPLMISLIVGSVISGQLISRLGIYKILTIIGAVITTIGVILFTTLGTTSTHSTIVWYMIIYGFGNGFILPSLTIAIQNTFSKKDMGVATASFQFFKNLGGSIGVAVLGAILTSGMDKEVSSAAEKISVLNTSIHNIFLVCVGVSVVAVVITVLLKQIPIRKDE